MAIALESVVKQLSDSGIVAPGKLEGFVPPKASPKDGEELLRELLKQNLLTKFQAQQCAAGRGKALILGNYILLDKIGAGGMGQVFKAEHRRMKRVVAIKMLPKALLSDAAASARFQREVEAAAKLSHPNIVAAHDADEANGVHFLVMEYVEGSDLSALVKKGGPLPVAKALQCILQTARGLEFAHGQGIIHRDIKPGNLLLDKTGRIKILDMGLARIDAPGAAGPASAPQMELTGTGAIMGTVDYMAPEQALSTHRADARSDVYSLGCTLYYLLSGQQIYSGDSVVEKLIAHREQPIPSLQGAKNVVPKAVEAVFRKMVAKKPDERYQTMSEVVAAIQGCGKQQASATVQASALPTAQALPDTDTAIEAVTAIVDEPARMTSRPRGPKKASGKAKSGSKSLIYGLSGATVFGVVAVAGVLWMLSRGSPDATIRTAAATSGQSAAEPGRAALATTDKPAAPATEGKAGAVTPGKSASATPAWIAEVSVMPAAQQVAAVTKKLQELNPEFDGKVDHHVDGGNVVELSFRPDNVTDISPLKVFRGLKTFSCDGSAPGRGKLADLSPLAGLPLTRLTCGYSRVTDLSPLRGMPLTMLFCSHTQVADLSPLAGLPLTELHCASTPVTDLSPLAGMPLTVLTFGLTNVSDLKPLAGMKLTSIDCGSTKVSDLSPLLSMPITTLRIGSLPVADLALFRQMPLERLYCGGTKVVDLSPLSGTHLTFLDCGTTHVADLSPLAGLPLSTLWCGRTRVSDLSPLRGMPLTDLACDDTKVSDLTPLQECRGLKRIEARKTGVTEAGIAALQKALPGCKIEWDAPATVAAMAPAMPAAGAVPASAPPGGNAPAAGGNVPAVASAPTGAPASASPSQPSASLPIGSGGGRLPRPTPAAQQIALEKLKVAHHDAWVEATDHVHRSKLMKELLQLAAAAGGTDERFACYEAAVQLAAADNDLSRALAVIGQWSTTFDIDAQAASIKTIDEVINAAKTPGQRKDLAMALLPVMDEQMVADRYDLADVVLNAALPLVAKVRDQALSKEYKLRESEMQQWLKLWSAARDAQARLADSPGDADAHAALGRYLCLARGEWSQGLPHLRQGSDELLQAAAKAELAVPVNADAQAEVGEAWWNIGDKEKAKGSVFPKLVWQEHAVQWITKSLPKLPATTKNKLKPRVSQFAQQRKAAGTIFTRRRPLDVEATFGGHWYKFYQIPVSWPEAKRRCEAMGGHLVFVETSEENEFVKSLIFAGTAGDGDFRTWLGARAYEGDGRLFWLDGSQVAFADWLNKSEADKAAADSIDFFLGYWNGGPPTMGMRWFRQPERMTGYFVCEWEQ